MKRLSGLLVVLISSALLLMACSDEDGWLSPRSGAV